MNRDVLILCQYFYPEYISSATLPYDTAKKISISGRSVSVICGYPYEYSKQTVSNFEIKDGIRITRIKYFKSRRENIIGRFINYLSFTISVYLRIGSMKYYKTIIVYSNPPLLPWVALKAKERHKSNLIFVAYDLYPEIAILSNVIVFNSFLSKIMNNINLQVFKSVDIVVALSNEMKNYIVKNRKIDSDKVKVIPNWYKDQFPILSKTNSKFIDLNNKIVISYLGNMGICQDIESLIELSKSMKDYSEFIFVFAGHGSKVNLIKQVILEGSQNIKYYDFLQGDDFLDLISLSSYYAVSLISGMNGLSVPSKTYAGMMANKKIICIMEESSDIAQDVIKSQSGIVVKNGEISKLKDYLLSNNQDPKSRKVYLKKYTPEICLNKYVEILNELEKK